MSKLKRSENIIMFLCERDILNGTPEALPEVKAFIKNYFQYNGAEFEHNFSFDNWKLVACWMHKFYETCGPVPIFGWHSVRIYDNLPFFIFCKAPKIFFFLRPIISFFLILGVVNIWEKNSSGQEYIDTDGDRIAFYVTEVFGFKWTRKFIDWFIKRSQLKSWQNIFEIYNYREAPWVLEAFYRKYGDEHRIPS